MKNWDTTKTVLTIIIIILAAALAYEAKWFGNTKGLFSRTMNGDPNLRGRKTECIGGYVVYAGLQSNIPCTSSN